MSLSIRSSGKWREIAAEHYRPGLAASRTAPEWSGNGPARLITTVPSPKHRIAVGDDHGLGCFQRRCNWPGSVGAAEAARQTYLALELANEPGVRPRHFHWTNVSMQNARGATWALRKLEREIMFPSRPPGTEPANYSALKNSRP